jgi:phospholipid/cholesterol/gamma-HCH transport system substrate-binding protein
MGMDKKKRNVAALGALTVLAIVVFFWGFYYLLGNPVLKGGMDLVVALENGAGLKRGDRVELQGVEVGSVKSVGLEGSQRVISVLRLNDKLPLPADTRARVSGDVFGAHAVELVPGTAMVKLEDGDTISGMSTPQLAEMAGELSTRATGLLTRADSLLSSETVRDLRATASVLPSSALELRAAFTELRLASAALRRTAEEVEGARTGAALQSAVTRVEESARALTGTASALERSASSLASVIRKIDNGQGTLGRLVNDSTLYFEFFGAAREIRTLAADVRARPRRYINLEIF